MLPSPDCMGYFLQSLSTDIFDCTIEERFQMINKSYRSAQETLKKVIDESMTAFYYSAGKKKGSRKVFLERMTAVQLIIFCKKLSESYDEEKNCFIPYAMLDEKKKCIIGGELEVWTKKSMEEKSKVNTKTFFLTDEGKKNTLQDYLDCVLKISYPYISESRNLTSMNSKISSTEDQIEIKVVPSLLPVGEEDYSVLPLCKRTYHDGSSTSIKIQIWRTESDVHCKYTNTAKCPFIIHKIEEYSKE